MIGTEKGVRKSSRKAKGREGETKRGRRKEDKKGCGKGRKRKMEGRMTEKIKV